MRIFLNHDARAIVASGKRVAAATTRGDAARCAVRAWRTVLTAGPKTNNILQRALPSTRYNDNNISIYNAINLKAYRQRSFKLSENSLTE